MHPTYTNIEGYVPSPANITKDDNLIIIELENIQLKLLGQLIHIYIINCPESILAAQLLNSLSTQSDSINTNPEDHKVFKAEKAPYNAIKSEGAWIIPFEEFK